jgi:hypothetical protein
MKLPANRVSWNGPHDELLDVTQAATLLAVKCQRSRVGLAIPVPRFACTTVCSRSSAGSSSRRHLQAPPVSSEAKRRVDP